ncbi:MAG TPA: replication factor C large subunit [Candidatus Methanomethylophilaceae archaeon]|nr:replication factor C large subunit [Candidatus Methanomethylophilaceae archaeon]
MHTGGPDTSDDWATKYRPKTLDDVLGNPGAVRELRSWAKSWDEGIPNKRAVVLMGPPGIGKTSAALALASDMGWGVVEMNASDQRTGGAIEDIALRGAMFNTFTSEGEYLRSSEGGRKLIILDEADSLFGRQDRGAMPAIVKLITETKQPVILIVNDFYELSRKSASVKTKTLQIKFQKPVAVTVSRVLRNISDDQGLDIGPATIKMIADNAAGDVRAAVSDLQSIAQGKITITKESAKVLSERDSRSSMYDLVYSVFRKKDPSASRRVLMETDSDPENAILWIDENLPHEYIDKGDLVRGYEKLSRADLFLGRVHRRQHYGFWSYAGDMMTFGVATARRSDKFASGRINFPQYLMKMSRSKSIRRTKKDVCLKLAVFMHTSTKRVEHDVLPYIKLIAANNAEFRASIVRNANLDSEELAFLIGKKIDSKEVIDAMVAAAPEPYKKKDQNVPVLKEDYPVVEILKTDDKPSPKGGQKSLFDY